jgi:hypothetical protein
VKPCMVSGCDAVPKLACVCIATHSWPKRGYLSARRSVRRRIRRPAPHVYSPGTHERSPSNRQSRPCPASLRRPRRAEEYCRTIMPVAAAESKPPSETPPPAATATAQAALLVESSSSEQPALLDVSVAPGATTDKVPIAVADESDDMMMPGDDSWPRRSPARFLIDAIIGAGAAVALLFGIACVATEDDNPRFACPTLSVGVPLLAVGALGALRSCSLLVEGYWRNSRTELLNSLNDDLLSHNAVSAPFLAHHSPLVHLSHLPVRSRSPPPPLPRGRGTPRACSCSSSTAAHQLKWSLSLLSA